MLSKSLNQQINIYLTTILSKMKSLKQVASILMAIAKAKSTMVKSKTRAIKAQIMISKLLHDRKVAMSVVSRQNQTAKDGGLVKICNKDIMPYSFNHSTETEDSMDEVYSRLTNELQFETEDNADVLGNEDSKNSQEEESDLSLENEIDKAADVFIRRFHRQMRIQKQESFRRYLEMLEKSA